MGNSGRSPQGKPAATESRYQTYDACWLFYCFHNPPNSDMDHGIFNVRKDVNACDCTRAGPMLYHLSYIPTPHTLLCRRNSCLRVTLKNPMHFALKKTGSLKGHDLRL